MEIREIRQRIITFVTKRNWSQFHNPKDVALSLTLEASEVLEHFQWKSEEEVKTYVTQHKKAIGKELADVLYWVVLLSHYVDIDLDKAFKQKMRDNEKKYPIRKSKGRATKYTEL